MRDLFVSELIKIAQKDPDVILLTGDLGFGIFEVFESNFPDRFFNVGVSEQNMIGIGTGLSLEGKKVVIYSLGNFPTLRCLEQIRNDACYHEANITIVSSGGGLSYGALGMSHHATEDLSIMRSLPNMTVIAPSSGKEAAEAINALITNNGTGYLRLDKSYIEDHLSKDVFKIGKARKYTEGKDLTLITTGGIIKNVLEAHVELKKIGVHARVLGMHTIKPIDEEIIIDSSINTNGIVTIEEHNKSAGLGSAVSEVCMDHSIHPKKFLRIGLNDIFISMAGDQDFLRTKNSIDSKGIYKQICNFLNITV